MNETLEHSKSGITSFLIAAGIWLYVLLLSYVFFYTNIINSIFPKDKDIGFLAQGAELIFFIFIYLVIPGIGYLIGLSFGVVGLMQKNRKRLLAIVGLILNILPFVLVAIYNLSF